MPLQLTPSFRFLTVQPQSLCEETIRDYMAGKPVLADDVVRLKLNEPVLQIVVQKDDKLRAYYNFCTAFRLQGDNGTSYYLMAPIAYDGSSTTPEMTTPITCPDELAQMEQYISSPGLKLSSFKNTKKAEVPPNFNSEQHQFRATPYWLYKNRGIA